MRRSAWIGLCIFLLAPCAALANEAWDHRHMKSRYRGVLTDPLPSTPVTGTNTFEDLQRGGQEARTEVPETLSHTTQRAWSPGRAPVSFGEAERRPRGSGAISGGRSRGVASGATSNLRNGIRSSGVR